MEYHFGICIKECKWGNNQYSYIVVLAGNEKDNEFSLFTKIVDKEEEEKNNLNSIKYGSAVFFISEGEVIFEICNVDEMFSSPMSYTQMTYKEIHLIFSVLGDGLRAQIGNRVIRMNQKESVLMIALHKGWLYKKHSNSIPKFSVDYIQSIIKEEEEYVESCDVSDMIDELRISYYASNFYIKTDEPESYKLYEERRFERTKYENFKLDSYLFQLLEPGSWFIEEYEGWFYAREESEDKVNSKNASVPWLKERLKSKYSKSEHLNYRVRLRLFEIMNPLFDMSAISGRIIDLNDDNLRRGTLKYQYIGNNTSFTFSESDNKNVILSKIKEYPVRYLVDKIFKPIQPYNMARDWCIPSPICTKGDARFERIFWRDW